jgi:hypothetical protein
MKKSGILISSMSRKTGMILYCMSMFFFIIAIYYCLDTTLLVVIISAIMLFLTLKFYVLKFITIDNQTVILQGLFENEISKDISSVDKINKLLLFDQVARISFKDGGSYFFLCKSNSVNLVKSAIAKRHDQL